MPRRLKIAQNHKTAQNLPNTGSKNPGACFFEVAEAPQAAATQTHRAGRPLGHDGTLQIYNNMENQIFLKKWNLTGKTQVKSHLLLKILYHPTVNADILAGTV